MFNNGDDVSPKSPKGISRRTIVKGAAWSVPVVIIGTAAPAMAVSGNQTATAVSASHNGANYTFTFNITNSSTHTYSIAGFTASGFTGLSSATTTINANGSTTVTVVGQNNAKPSNVTLSFTLSGAPGGNVVKSVTFNNIP